MKSKLRERNDSAHWIIVQDCPQETEFPRVHSREDKVHVPRGRVRNPRISRHHKWSTGRTTATLHR